MMKKIYYWCKSRIIILGILFSAFFYFLHVILNIFNLEFRQWIIYSVILISLILIIIGSFQLILKIKNLAIKITTMVLSITILLVSSPYAIFLFGFSYRPEHVVIKNDIRLVAYVEGFLHTNVSYYDYKNLFVRSTYLRLYEDYGSGGFDPIKNEQVYPHEAKSYTWYDNDGKPIDQ